ncbi:MAG: hypothetical protein CL424_14795 [Acidimicrobiaceae bacterium]|nr:hypothetical protein [Acidimicrobiaceae bacterium]
MSRCRLLLMSNSVSMGGMEEHVRLVAREIDRTHFEIVALAPDWEPTAQFSASLAEAADRFAYSTPDRRHGTRRLMGEVWRLFRRARRDRYDVAHLHSTSYEGLTFAIVALRVAGVGRIFVTEHLAPDEPVPAVARKRRALLMRLVTGLVCVSENNRDSRARHLGLPSGRTHVVNNGIDITRFDDVASPEQLDQLREEFDIDPGVLVVGTAVRLEPGKGVGDLVDAFESIQSRHPNSVLLIVGEGTLRPELQAQAAALGVAATTRFLGYRSDPRPYVLLMDVFVLPVPFGSASIALLEAMAMSRPCVITFGDGREAVQHGTSGFCAEPHDAASIARCVNMLFEDPVRRREVGHAARARVEQDYSAVRVARELEGLYRGG